jgi:conjugative relaxase-like TrwC/TraI family protein
VAAAVQKGHAKAVAAALGYLERHAAIARRGHGGHELVRGNGFIAAVFQHRTSRAGDPLLHSHGVIANLTCGPDGRWTALDGRVLYNHGKTAGYLYQAVLRHEVTRELGVAWDRVRNGVADIAGIPRAVVVGFSQRRQQITRRMAERGERSAKAAQVEALDTWTSPCGPDTVTMRPGVTVAGGRVDAAVPTPRAVGSRWWSAAGAGCTRQSSGRSRPVPRPGCGSGVGRLVRP